MTTSSDTQQKILEAAEARFTQYGFSKTTMNEIAEDCKMSAANIYRFFKSKHHIVAEMAIQFFRSTEDALRQIVQTPGLSASQRLEMFTLKILHSTYDLFANQPKIKEIIDFVSSERLDLVRQHEDVKRSLVAEILADGKRSGEFAVDDIVATAEFVLKATVMFHCPILIDFHPFEEMERFSKGVVDLLVRGLSKA